MRIEWYWRWNKSRFKKTCITDIYFYLVQVASWSFQVIAASKQIMMSLTDAHEHHQSSML